MPKFLRQSSVVDAVQFPCDHPAIKTCGCAEYNRTCETGSGRMCWCCDMPVIQSPDSEKEVGFLIVLRDGDWIITHSDGTVSRVQNERFQANFSEMAGY